MSLTYGIDDEHEQLSLDCVELNKVVLAMRPLIKRSKVLVLRELAAYIKRQKLKQSKLSDDKGKRLGRKIVNRLAEIRLLKKFSSSNLCKLILANIMTHEEMEKGGENMSKQDRIVIRMACRPEIATFVNRFRGEHKDWPTLVHFLLYKNTSGKWKTTEQKKKKRKKKGDLPFPIVDTEDVFVGEEESSTVKKFTAFKEAHDRELIARQKKILDQSDEDEEEKTVAVGPKPIPPREMVFDSADLDEALAIIKPVGRTVKNRDISTSASEIDEEEPSTNIPTEEAELKEESIKRRRDPSPVTAKVTEKSFSLQSEKSQTSKKKTVIPADEIERPSVVHAPAIADEIHEVIFENEDVKDLFGSDDENPLGADDVEMKQELRERKPRPGDSAIYKRALHQQKPHQFRPPQMPRGPFQPGLRGRGGGRGGGVDNRRGSGGTPRYQKPEMDTEGMHPSWVAKRQQKQLAAISISGVASSASAGKRIVFGDD